MRGTIIGEAAREVCMNADAESTNRLRDENASLRRRIAELEDSERRHLQSEAVLRDQLRFLQTLIDTIPSPVFYKDAKGRYLGCNRAFEIRLGVLKENILGKRACELFPEELASKYDVMDRELLSNPGEQMYESKLLFADGIEHDVVITKGTFTNSRGELAGLVGVTLDISERKRAEEALQKAHDELENRVQQRTADLARTNEKLRKEISERLRAEEALVSSSEKLKMFAYSVAHDLKSPAIGIHGLTSLLLRNYGHVLDNRGAGYCDRILKTSENVVALVDEINAYIAAKEAPLTIEAIRIEEVFRTVREEFHERLANRKVEWSEMSLATEIRADKLSLLRIFRNLVDNALKYGGETLSRIEIGCRVEEGSHIFRVHDDGAGLKSDNPSKVFGPFQRAGTSKGVEGTGLGLAIVKELVERHGGKVWVDSKEEEGTSFYISISGRL
jgi:PAS domain S-box-containing protein